MKTKIKIQDYLLADGIYPSVKGFTYLVEAITHYEQDMGITKELYPFVAEKHNTTANRVERSIRHAISTGDKIKEKPITNSNYIALAKMMIERV